MKIENLSFVATLDHVVASFTDQYKGDVYWASKCSCGSDTDESNKCLVVKKELADAN